MFDIIQKKLKNENLREYFTCIRKKFTYNRVLGYAEKFNITFLLKKLRITEDILKLPKWSVQMKKIFNYFLIGVLAFIPVVVILQIVLFVKQMMIDSFSMVSDYSDSNLITGVFLGVSFLIFTYVGYRVAMGRSLIISIIDTIIDRIPLLNTVYRVTKKIVNMFSGHEEHTEKEVVYIEYPKDGLWVPAYVTNKTGSKYILFVPTSPNPTSGFTVIVDESKVTKSEMDIEEATSFIISVGVDYNKSDEAKKLG